MLNGIGNIAYLGAAVLFILSLRGLSHPSTARRGNIYGVVGMLIAVVATLLIAQGAGLAVVLAAAVIGAAIGAVLARRVEINDDLLVFQTKLFDRNVGAVCPRATVVGVEGDFVSSAAHLEGGDVGTSQEALSLVGGMTSNASNCSVLL